MRICMHTNHWHDTAEWREGGKKRKPVEIVIGWNPVRRTAEMCDQGFIPEKRKESKRKAREV